MRNIPRASLGLIVGLLMISVPMFAHHGGSEYDTKNLVTLKGTVTEFHWANPHCQVFFDAKDDAVTRRARAVREL